MFDWIAEQKELLTWLGVASAICFVGSLIAVPILVARIPEDYFATRRAPALPWQRHHPVLRWLLRGLKNGVGLLLIAAGIAMLVLPGQGILTIFLGLVLLDFPGKRVLERGLVARPGIQRTLNWIRKKAGRPPLRIRTDLDIPTDEVV